MKRLFLFILIFGSISICFYGLSVLIPGCEFIRGCSEEEVASFSLSPDDKKTLLHIARTSVEEFVRHQRIPEIDVTSETLKGKGAAFVTLKKDGHLRGCIGHVVARIPLYQCVQQVAISAATRDRRFRPVLPDELGSLDYEISVLTPPEKVFDPSTIEVGRDGLVIRMGGRSGLLLPQVATENGWDREEFLRHTCRKAGLPFDAWEKGAEILRFQALVFSE